MVRFIIEEIENGQNSNKNLHSNMVRFIIRQLYPHAPEQKIIYIPIWLDLL